MLTGTSFTAAKRLGEGKSEVLKSFDPTAEETFFVPRQKGRLNSVGILSVSLVLRAPSRSGRMGPLRRPRQRGHVGEAMELALR
jgi:hypothetical protein